MLKASLFSGAYYICGYAVECALKACICKNTNQFDFYPHPKVVQKAWTHNFGNLIEVSGLKSTFDAERQTNSELNVNWQIVEDWSEDSRYENHEQKEAEDLYTALTDPAHGVLQCIERYW